MKKFKFNKVSLAILVFVLMFGLGGIIAIHAFTNPAPVVLGTAGNFAVLAGAGITSTAPPQVIIGNAGSDPTVSNGLTGAEVTGTNYTASNAAVIAAKVALSTAYADVSTRPQSGINIPTDLATQNLTPGIYHAASGTFGISGAGTLTLDGGGNPNAVFIFKTDTTLITGGASSVVLTNGAQACNVFWAVGSAATLDHTTFVGTIMANTEAITDAGGSTINGRLLANVAAVTLNNTHVTVPTCAPSLLLQKAIAGGGPDLSSAWTLTATGTGSPTNLSGITGATGANSDLQFPNATFKADTYTLAETGPTTNYAATYSCIKINNGVTTTTTSNLITLVAGDKATCTITNTYTVPATTTLKLVKTVTNNNGGTALNTAWTLTATGAGGFSDNGGTTGTFHTVTAGVGYVLSESSIIAGYTAGNWSCDGGSLSGSTITLSAGQNVTCTIANDDNAPVLHLRKLLIKDNGGTAVLTDWTLTAVGTLSSPTNLSGGTPVDSDTNFKADTYTLGETGPSGYTASSWSCVGASVTGTSITLGLGDVATCTITNDDNTPPSSGGGGGGSYTPLIPPLIDVVKIPSPLALPAGPGPVTYTYTLRNIGTVPITNITMVDDSCSPMIFLSGDINANAKLDVNETWTYDCFKTLSATHTNTVTATGWANGISAVDIASATVVVGLPVVPPLIHVTKIPNPLALPAGAGEVTYTYTVTNPGTVPLSNVYITDDKCTGLPGRVLGHPGDLNKNNLLESNESWSFTCKSNLTKTTTNTATASGSANGLTAKDFAIATVVVADTTPTLPNTGFPPEERSATFPIILFSGLSAFSIFLYFARKKQTT